MNNCQQCRHGQKVVNGQRLCDVGLFTRPVEYMRDDRSECGMAGRLFEPLERKFAEHDDA